MVRHIQSLSKIANAYDAFIIDIFGVLHDGITPFPDTVATLQSLNDAGKELCLLSNSPRRAHNAAAQMEGMGIGRGLYNHIVTSGESTHNALASGAQDFGRNCWFVGKYVVEEIVAGLDDMRLHEGPQEASFILNAIPGTSPPEVADFKAKLETAAAKNLPMICANPDLVVHVGDTLYECAGTFAATYEEMGGIVHYHGKPHAPVYERCYELLGHPEKSRICAIGDSLHTDIAGANGFGIDSILNLAGIHREEDHESFKNAAEKPTYLMDGFCW